MNINVRLNSALSIPRRIFQIRIGAKNERKIFEKKKSIKTNKIVILECVCFYQFLTSLGQNEFLKNSISIN